MSRTLRGFVHYAIRSTRRISPNPLQQYIRETSVRCDHKQEHSHHISAPEKVAWTFIRESSAGGSFTTFFHVSTGLEWINFMFLLDAFK